MRDTIENRVTAYHAVITPECRDGRGDTGAIDEALKRIRNEYLACLPGWSDTSAKFHVELYIERPAEAD